MKTTNKTSGGKKRISKRTEPYEAPEIKPDYPLSEKDEVKQAEERLRKAVKKNR